MRPAFAGIFFSLFALALSGCSSLARNKPVVYASGDKAVLGPLAYSVVDTDVLTQLGNDPAAARTPRNRFYLVKVSIANSSSRDLPIPGMTLVSDSGQTYGEVADGTGVPEWLGVVRSAGPFQTEEGNILFDAPAGHYRLKLTDDLDEKDVSIDIPLTYEHQEIKSLAPPSPPEQLAIPRK